MERALQERNDVGVCDDCSKVGSAHGDKLSSRCSMYCFYSKWGSVHCGECRAYGNAIAGSSDKSGAIYQTLPWNHRGWHSGGSGNNTHIGVEMCEPSCIEYQGGSTFTCTDKAVAKEVVKRTYLSAVELFSYLCKLYNLNPLGEGVILSHNEGYKKGIATNHGDPEHLWRGLGLGYTMDGFREAVYAKMKKEENEEAISKAKPYLVRVEASNLNIRKGPGANYARTGKYTGVGIFTIVDEADGAGASRWGKLKSGAGWISLDYTKIA